MKDFQESNNFLKLFPSAFKTKKKSVAGLIAIHSWGFSKMEQKCKSANFHFKIDQN